MRSERTSRRSAEPSSEEELPPLTGEHPVEIHEVRPLMVTLLVVFVLFEIALLVALGNAVVQGGWGTDIPGAWLAWPVVILFALLFGAAIWLYAWHLVHGGTILTTTECRDRDPLVGGPRIVLEEATSLAVADDGADRRLVLTGPDGASFRFDLAGSAWPQVASNLRAWVAARPELVADPETRAALATAR